MSVSAVGIDLGTTYSCVGVFQHGKVEILANEQGNRTTPSFVAFTDTEILIGEAAVNQVALNSENTVFDTKRIIGRSFNDESVQGDLKYWPFKVLNEDDLPKIQVEHQEESKIFSPEDISSIILNKMKEVAEGFLGHSVKDVVLTIPSNFNDSQRLYTKKAGKLAGLNVMKIINEPSAAAIAYGLDKKVEKDQNVLIFDLGGGTFDVSILSIQNGIFKVKSSTGDARLGGEDFDSRMVNHFVQEFKRKYKTDISENKRSMRRLRTACESAKRTLSTNNQANIEIDSLYDGMDLYTKISRARFEELNGDLFKITIDCVEQVLDEAKLDKIDIDEVVLVGGSSKIPKVQQLLQEFFEGKELNKSINPDEVVAYGAAIYASTITCDSSDLDQELQSLEVAPISIGLQGAGGVQMNLIKKSMPIPTKQTRLFTTYTDNQVACLIKVYEGERSLCKDNNLLSKFELTGIPPAPRGVPQIEVTFEMDVNGLLNVSAIDQGTGKVMNVTVHNDKSRLSKNDISKMMSELNIHGDDDKLEKEKIESRLELESYAYQMKLVLEDAKIKNSIKGSDAVVKKCDQIITWLANNSAASKEECDRWNTELEQACAPIVASLL